MGAASHAVTVNGLCVSPMLGKARAIAAAHEAAAARPDAVVCVVRYASPSALNPSVVAVVSAADAVAADAVAADAVAADAVAADAVAADAVAADAVAADAVAADAVAADAVAADAVAADAVAADAAYTEAWLAADTATADLVPLSGQLADVVAASVRALREQGRAVAVAAGLPIAHETARTVLWSLEDHAATRVADAVADACSGYEPDAVPVVVVPADAFAHFACLQRCGVAAVRPAAPVDAAPAGAWFATCGARPSLVFPNVADALEYATGHAAPVRTRSRRRAVLSGESTPPIAPSHGANAPTLPRIR